MNNREFSDSFTSLLNSYKIQAPFGEQVALQEIALDEYEKSLYLTRAQEDLILSSYTGKNPFGDSFESSEEIRRYLDVLINTQVYQAKDAVTTTSDISNDKSWVFVLPDKAAFITLEQVIFDDKSLGCYNGARVNVQPIKQDEYNKVKDNPFRGATKYRVLRLDNGSNSVEIFSKYNIKNYIVRYVTKPTPIILVDLPNDLAIDGYTKETECALNSILHKQILERAVQLALREKSIHTDK